MDEVSCFEWSVFTTSQALAAYAPYGLVGALANKFGKLKFVMLSEWKSELAFILLFEEDECFTWNIFIVQT